MFTDSQGLFESVSFGNKKQRIPKHRTIDETLFAIKLQREGVEGVIYEVWFFQINNIWLPLIEPKC